MWITPHMSGSREKEHVISMQRSSAGIRRRLLAPQPAMTVPGNRHL